MATPVPVPSTLGNSPTRRNLFGPVDREQLQVEYQAALHKDVEEASKRWGFDFISDKPLESSDFQWESVPGTKVPLLYRSCMPDPGQAEVESSEEVPLSSRRGRVVPPKREKENIPVSPKRCAINLDNLEKTPRKRENSGLKRRQTNITDFYKNKRRRIVLRVNKLQQVNSGAV